MTRRRLPREPSSCGFDIVAGALHLIDEIVHIRRQPTGHEDSDIEFARGCVLLGLVETGFETLQVLRALGNYFIVHEIVPSPRDKSPVLTLFLRRVPSRDEALHEAAREAVHGEATGAFAAAIKPGDRLALQIDDAAAAVDAEAGAG